jgi:hypothetical protein
VKRVVDVEEAYIALGPLRSPNGVEPLISGKWLMDQVTFFFSFLFSSFYHLLTMVSVPPFFTIAFTCHYSWTRGKPHLGCRGSRGKPQPKPQPTPNLGTPNPEQGEIPGKLLGRNKEFLHYCQIKRLTKLNRGRNPANCWGALRNSYTTVR